MKSIHYDAEGDILSVSFAETDNGRQTGVELSDNIVLYLDPVAEQPLKLIMSSYQAMLQVHAQSPIALDGLENTPTAIREKILRLLQHTPLTNFLQMVETSNSTQPAGILLEVFAPAVAQSM